MILVQYSVESEMVASTIAIEEVGWLKCLLAKIPPWKKMHCCLDPM